MWLKHISGWVGYKKKIKSKFSLSAQRTTTVTYQHSTQQSAIPWVGEVRSQHLLKASVHLKSLFWSTWKPRPTPTWLTPPHTNSKLPRRSAASSWEKEVTQDNQSRGSSTQNRKNKILCSSQALCGCTDNPHLWTDATWNCHHVHGQDVLFSTIFFDKLQGCSVSTYLELG